MITAEKILENRNWIHECIDKYISSPRKEKLLEFYNKYDARLTMMAAAHKKEYHNSFDGGYLDHVRRVIEIALEINEVWKKFGVDETTYTTEELVFSALNHDLGKMGDEEHESYIPQEDNWRRDKLGEVYMFNEKLAFASVPDRGLFLLQSHGIQYSFNEMLAIQTHDGLYDEANKKYLLGFSTAQKPRTSLPYILHQADLAAARIEWERDWLPQFKNPKSPITRNVISEGSKMNKQQKTLKSVKSKGLESMLDNL